MREIVILGITSFYGSLDAEHYYGKLYYEINGDLKTLELERLVTSKKELKYLSKKSGWEMDPDMPTMQFNKPEDIEAEALKVYKTLCPDAIALLVGRYAVADPQRVLDGPEILMKRGNELFDEAESIGWYEEDEPRMKKLSDEWRDIIAEIKKVAKGDK